MRAFTHDALPGRVVFGVGSVERVGEQLEGLVARRALLIAAGSAIPVADRIAVQLDSRLAGRFSEVAQHVPETLAQAASETAAGIDADVVVAVGGGSAIGLAKAVAVGTGIPVVAVPTTYSGSEMTPIYGITGQHKRTRRDLRALPKVVIYDPSLTIALPAGVTASSGFNALAHCVEALYAPGANPVASLFAEEAARSLGRGLPRAVERPDNLDARADALYGAYLAGAALAVTGTALHHKLCHVLGGTFGLVHGDLNAVLLPHVVAFNAPAAPDAVARVAAALGGDADPSSGAHLLADLALAIGAPTSLAAIGMPEDGLVPAAELAATQVGTGNPRPVDARVLEDLLRAAFEGRRPGS